MDDPENRGLTADTSITTLSSRQSSPASGPLQPGSTLGTRYRILSTLGTGGMGVVYKAWDDELGVPVALKVIKPEVSGDSQAASTVERDFKRELLLARQVTHKHVVRIHDIGEIDGIKYLTMPFIEGRDLAHVLHDEGRLPVARALQVAKQVAEGLVAAHEAAVVHRDLKPENVMIDGDEQAVIMDFGISRLETTATMTRTGTGTIVGTLEYMAPEQASGQRADHRADIYSFGLILYDMLAGRSRVAKAGTAIAELMERLQTPSRPLASATPSLPAVDAIIARCTQADPAKRYQTAAELLADLNRLGADGQPLRRARVLPVRLVAAAALVVLLVMAVAVGLWLRFRTGTGATNASSAAHAPVSVLVADFDNRTGEAVFDDTLEPMFNVALEGASFLNTFNRRTARGLAAKLPNPRDKLDEQAARLIAVSEGIDVVLTGSLSRDGAGYRVSVQALDGRTGKRLAAPEATVKTKDEVLRVIPKMVAPIREALGDSTPEAAQLKAVSGAFMAASLEAVRLDAAGVELQFAGRLEEAFQAFKKAAEVDPSFARAYSGMAAMAGNLGRPQEAERYINLAMKHMDRMTERERYRFRGQYYMNMGDWQKCVEEYTQLMDRYPVDRVGQSNLGNCLASARRAPEAVVAARRAAELVPKGASQRFNLAFLSSFAGDFSAGEREARETMKLAPSLGLAFLPLAEAQLGQGQLPQASESYRQLEKSDPSLAAIGLADLAAYEGRYGDAVRMLTDGIAKDVAAKAPESAAGKWAALADVQLARGQNRAALDAARNALGGSESMNVRLLAARVLIEAGEVERARSIAAAFDSKLTAEPQAYGRIIAGMAALHGGDAARAIKALTDAKGLLDTWIGRFELGRAYLAAGQFVQADAEFDRCLKRRGEAMELFLDNSPTYRFLPPVYYYGGRVREGLKSEGYAEFYRTYLGIRGRAGEDPLLPDIRRRLGQ